MNDRDSVPRDSLAMGRDPIRPTEDLPVLAGYAAWAAIYDDDGNPLTALEGPAMKARFASATGGRAIDLGCGTGRHIGAILDAGATCVVALDPSPEMMARARERLRGRSVAWVRQALPGPLPFRDATFDLAVLGLVIEHVDAFGAALAEVARVLTPGGRCLLSALHPDRTADGQRARFIDPTTGLRRSITTYHRTVADYLSAASAAGLVVEAEEALTVSTELGVRLPRALPYLGRTLGWLACWIKPARPGRLPADSIWVREA